jgi:cytochrome c551/c552
MSEWESQFRKNLKGKSMKSILVGLSVAALMVAGSATAGTFSTGSCKACHAVGKDLVGPDWKVVAEKYGDAKALAAVFKSGFKVEDRKVAESNPKWKGQAALMTGQFNSLIKGKEDDAAEALFAAVKAGKI